MTDPEREHFARQVADLEGRLRRWQLISFVLAAFLLVPIVGGGLLGVLVFPRMQAERYRAAEMEMRARMEAERAEEALREAEEARKQAEEKRANEHKAREKD
jgi:hypothetical protein